jgi:hypothetical protein
LDALAFAFFAGFFALAEVFFFAVVFDFFFALGAISNFLRCENKP